ncbi:hypothetical protein Pst134EB_001912 [Puccinia striiformis f. sp. tritici]|nr:hypothetical protein Pst134EB_001912 [Puccinia striiformis f. sp. tritici]
MTTSFDFYDSLWQWNDESNHNELPGSLLGLSPSSIRVLKNLLQRPAVPDTFPIKRRAAVMVGLFASRHGHLNVLLTRRSKTMRTYAGETALPGGKMEPKDSTLEETARREAQEECGITRNPDKVIKLTSLDPFLTRSNLIVTPIVFFITDQSLMVTFTPFSLHIKYIYVVVYISLVFLLGKKIRSQNLTFLLTTFV